MDTVIIDDEFQIREGLKILLENTELSIVGEANNVEDALNLIENKKPALVLLDIQLDSNNTGFDVLDKLVYKNFKVIFITAYSAYAIKAFKYNAFDYLLKPIDPEELYDTINRVKKETINSIETSLRALKENNNFEKVVIKTTNYIHTLALKDIVRCEADQSYTHFYLKNNKRVLSSKPLKEYDQLFAEKNFIRVHQSHLVNKSYINTYHKAGKLILSTQEEIPVSVRKRKMVREHLNLN